MLLLRLNDTAAWSSFMIQHGLEDLGQRIESRQELDVCGETRVGKAQSQVSNPVRGVGLGRNCRQGRG